MGDTSEATVRAFAAALNAGTPGDARAGLRVFKGRPHDNLVQSYGADFAATLERATPGVWQALQTREGWRAMRLDSIAAAKPASFEALRGVVLQTGPTPPRPSSAAQRCARWPRSTRSSSRARPNDQAAHSRAAAGSAGVVVRRAARARDDHGRDAAARDHAREFLWMWDGQREGQRHRRPEARMARRLRGPSQRAALWRSRAARHAGRPRRGPALFGRDGEGVLARRPVARLHAHRRPADGAALRLGRRPARLGRDRIGLHAAGRRTHPGRLRPSAVRHRPAVPGRLPAPAGVDHHRLHRRAQPHAGQRRPGLAHAAAGAGGKRASRCRSCWWPAKRCTRARRWRGAGPRWWPSCSGWCTAWALPARCRRSACRRRIWRWRWRRSTSVSKPGSC